MYEIWVWHESIGNELADATDDYGKACEKAEAWRRLGLKAYITMNGLWVRG